MRYLRTVIITVSTVVTAFTSARASVISPPGLGVVATEARAGLGNAFAPGLTSASGSGDLIAQAFNNVDYRGTVASSVTANGQSGTPTGLLPILNSSAGASASLASGTLRATGAAISFYGQIDTDSLGQPVYGFNLSSVAGFADLSDVLHVVGPISTPVQALLSMRVRGTSSGESASIYPQVVATLETLANGSVGWSSGGVYVTGTTVSVQPLNGSLSVAAAAESDVDFTLYRSVIVSDSTRDIDLLAHINTSPDLGSTTTSLSLTLDFGHTATLSLALPPGLSFTSDSGVFLSQAVGDPGGGIPTDIPEPASLILLSVAGAAIVAQQRNRNARYSAATDAN